MRGIIILAHGSKLRDEMSKSIVEELQSQMKNIAEAVRENGGWDVIDVAYLQFCQPNLHQSIESLVKKGCRKIAVVPFFLSSGNHVLRDIPDLVKQQEERYSGVEFVITKSLGKDSRIIDILLDLIREKMPDAMDYRSSKD